ncbi:RDD family protein [Planococcus sp. MERTA32b]|nr:RDD family protein [Planococcus sp. MER TA 32b]
MPPAGIAIRFKAFIWDYLWIFIYLCFVFLLSMVLMPGLQGFFNGPVGTAQLTGFLLVTLPISLYFTVADSGIFNGTFGKKRTGIQVVNAQGMDISLLRSLFRIILKFLPWELSHFLIYRLMHLGEAEFPLHLMIIGGLIYILMFAYILTAVFSKEKRSLYDRLSGTKVIRV